jgi:crossover junction endodeoxyribonuclease RuvC
MAEMEEYYLGIDPSIWSTGWGLLNGNHEIVDYGRIKADKHLAIHEVVEVQYRFLSELLAKYSVSSILCEDQYQGCNVDTLKKLSQNRGAIMLLAAQKQIPFRTMAPSSWRKAFIGLQSGKANKKDCVRAINDMYGLKLKFVQNDIAEALAMAHVCVSKAKENQA